MFVTLHPKCEGQATLKEVDGSAEFELNIDQFHNKYKPKPYILKRKDRLLDQILYFLLPVICLIMILFILFDDVREYYKRRKLVRLLDLRIPSKPNKANSADAKSSAAD